MLSLPERPRLVLLTAWSLALSVTLSAAWPSVARAQQPSAEAVAEARRNEAKAKFEEGVAAFRKGRYAEAVQAFERADAIAPSAALSFNIARSFERLDNTSAALRWYRDFVRRSPQAPNLADVQARIANLASKLSERGVQQISVLSTPDGAAVLIDNQPVGSTPLTIELVPGPHQLGLRLAGYRDQQTQIALEARTPQDVSMRLEPLTPGAGASAGADKPAEPPGAGQAPSDRPAATKLERPYGVAPWVVLTAGGASLVAAFSFELARRSAESEAERAPQKEYGDHYDAMVTRQTTARVLAGVGGALLVTSGVLLYLNQPKESSPKVALGCRGAVCGLSASGSFQ